MPIYPDKKHGQLTGRFAVEVQQGSRRLRGRRDTFLEAQYLETFLRAALLSGEAPEAKRKFTAKASRPDTYAEGLKRADGILWVGKASCDGNFQKLRAMGIILGDVTLDSIGTNEVDDMVIELAKTVADATVNRYLSALSVFLKFCQKRGWRTAALPSMDWRDEDEGRIRWFSVEEEDTLMDTLRGEMGLVVRVAIKTGFRRSELLSLTADQVRPGWVHLWKTKNGMPRSVPIDDETYRDLTSLMGGGMPSASKLRYEWQLAREAMGMGDDKEFVFHACRHTTATRMVQANVNLRVIQKLMGHKTIQTTLRYAHVNDTMLTEAIATVATYHRGGASAHRLSISDKSAGPIVVRGLRPPQSLVYA